MQNKMKRPVPCRSEINGTLAREWTETRMVYTRRDGSEYIHHMGAPKDLENGVAVFRARSIGKVSLGLPGFPAHPAQ